MDNQNVRAQTVDQRKLLRKSPGSARLAPEAGRFIHAERNAVAKLRPSEAARSNKQREGYDVASYRMGSHYMDVVGYRAADERSAGPGTR
jgi:hypothetical protein